MPALTSPKSYAALAVFHALDAVPRAIPIPPGHRAPRHPRIPAGWVAVGLRARAWYRGSARIRLIGLMAVLLVALCAAMSVQGPDRS